MKLILLSLTLFIFACTPPMEYTINGETHTALEGKEVKLHNASSDEAIDSTTVKGGKFQFKGSTKDLAIIYITMEKSRYIAILEGGDIEILMHNQVGEISGTPHNETINLYNLGSSKLHYEMKSKLFNLKAENINNHALVKQGFTTLYEEFAIESKRFTDSIFNANRLNIVGAYLYPKVIDKGISIAEIQEYMSENRYAKEDATILKILEAREAQ